MLHAQSPTAIVWTQTGPTYRSSVDHHVQADIRAINSWIEREWDLARIREFGDNWDGFEAAAPDPTVLERVSSFLRLLRDRDIANPPTALVLSPSGSIALEWLEGRSFLRAEIGDSNEVEWMLAIPGQPADFKVESLSPSASEALEGQEWKPAPAPVGELAYASAH
jgi:hypothetical protein